MCISSSPRRRTTPATPCFRAFFLLPLDRTLLYPLYLCCAKCYSFSLSLSPRRLELPTYIHTYIFQIHHIGHCGFLPALPVYRLIIAVVSTLPICPPNSLYLSLLAPKTTTPSRPRARPAANAFSPPFLPCMCAHARHYYSYVIFHSSCTYRPPLSVTIMSFLFHLNSIMVLCCS